MRRPSVAVALAGALMAGATPPVPVDSLSQRPAIHQPRVKQRAKHSGGPGARWTPVRPNLERRIRRLWERMLGRPMSGREYRFVRAAVRDPSRLDYATRRPLAGFAVVCARLMASAVAARMASHQVGKPTTADAITTHTLETA